MNDESSALSKGASSFRAILHPHRSLGPRGFAILMIAVVAINVLTAGAFYLLGAWPVVGFCGLDVLLLYVAFRLNYRAAQAYELVELTPSLLKLTQVEASGERNVHEFNPYWVRVRVAERHDGRTRLSLASHGREYEFGHVLNDDERRDFATVLDRVLASNRSGFRA